eukprot:gene10784-3401_t
MPRHLFCDAYEWINEIPIVPIYYLGNLHQREHAWECQRGKENPVELDSSLNLCNDADGVEQVEGYEI